MKLRMSLMVCLLAMLPQPAPAQEERIQKLFQDAIEAMGGATYLDVKDIVSEGTIFYSIEEAAIPTG